MTQTVVQRPQFGLRVLFGITFVSALMMAGVSWLLNSPFRQQVLGREGAFDLAFLAGCSGLAMIGISRQRAFVWAFAGVLVPLTAHRVCSLLVWHTLGETGEVGFCCITLPLFAPAILCAGRSYRASIVLSLLLLIVWIPADCLSVCFWLKLARMKAEVAHFAQYAEEVKKATGAYPEDLSEYDFDEPDFEPLLKYWPPDPTDANPIYVISVDLFEGDNTNREYSPHGWYYYPD